MADSLENSSKIIVSPQCQYFVVRKKRLCRMTVRPGRQYCGEHEPEPVTVEGKDDTRIPCPYDPKHTCYASKLEKHLSICNAKQTDLPPYIVHNVNAPADQKDCIRIPLSQIPRETVMKVIDKINQLYEKHVEGNIESVVEQPIHLAVLEEFNEGDRAESSRRHIRQASSLLRITEEAGLVQDNTCFVELGAGKGQLSYYMGCAWCDAVTNSSVVVIDRAALRHKRDNKIRTTTARLKADLAHLRLSKAPHVEHATNIVGLAKHLCGVATDYALRCMTAPCVLSRSRGVVLATCCHHRCERAHYTGNEHLQELDISGDDFNVMLGVVSWATCGDGRSRERRLKAVDSDHASQHCQPTDHTQPTDTDNKDGDQSTDKQDQQENNNKVIGDIKWREEVGRRAKALIDWGRILYLRSKGFDARLCYYVPSTVSLENVCIVATKISA